MGLDEQQTQGHVVMQTKNTMPKWKMETKQWKKKEEEKRRKKRCIPKKKKKSNQQPEKKKYKTLQLVLIPVGVALWGLGATCLLGHNNLQR